MPHLAPEHAAVAVRNDRLMRARNVSRNVSRNASLRASAPPFHSPLGATFPLHIGIFAMPATALFRGLSSRRFGLALALSAAVASAYTLDANAGAVIFNSLNPTSQTVALGVNDQGHLNTRDGNVVTNASATGIALNFGDAVSPDYRDATSPGCLCEGWGLAVTLNGGLGDRVSGFAGVDSGGIGGLTGGTFGATTTSATSLVSLFEEPRISITHEYGVSLAPNTFQGNVTIRNNSAETITDVVYRRAMDWDVPPTEFSEFVTHQGIVYMSLLDPENPLQALRKTVVPTTREFVRTPGEADDPLGEDGHSPVPGLVHRYPDRVLLLPLDFCSTYCRYCTRSRVVGHGEIQPNVERLEAIFHYLE